MTTTLLLTVLVALASGLPPIPTGLLPCNITLPPILPLKGHPIIQTERICPRRGDCYDSFGGRCTFSSDCDLVIYGADCLFCRCCINCDDNSCGASDEGVCRIECMEGEFTVEDCSRSCKCCEPCVDTSCEGRCVGDPSFCNSDEYIEGECDGGTCTCCVPCEPDDPCVESGGSCFNSASECPCGLWPNPDLGCSSDDCTCCVPCTPSSACADGPNPGRCVVDDASCDADDEYISDDDCISGDCSCCKTCTPDTTCSGEGGTCFATDIGCPSGSVPSTDGTCNTDTCICCVPE